MPVVVVGRRLTCRRVLSSAVLLLIGTRPVVACGNHSNEYGNCLVTSLLEHISTETHRQKKRTFRKRQILCGPSVGP
jgi:hypothetical protein